MKRSPTSQRGVSLIELLVGFAVALVVLIGAGSAFLAQNASTAANMRADKTNHDLQIVMDIMVSELRRSGYWNGEAVGAPAVNPYQDIFISADGTCVLYSYDFRDAAGTAATPDGLAPVDQERLGFRRTGNDIWMKTSGNVASATDCAVGNWERVTQPGLMNVTNLAFAIRARCVNVDTLVTTNAACTAASGAAGERTVEIRGVQIDLDAQAVEPDGTPGAVKSLTAFARIRNNAMQNY